MTTDIVAARALLSPHVKRQKSLICSETSIPAKCLRTLSNLFSPKLVNQASCRILTTAAKTRPILHDDWSIRLGENRPDNI